MSVVLQRANWNEEAERKMAEAIGNDPTYSIADLKTEVARGSTVLFAVIDMAVSPAERLGYCCLWVDPVGQARELVIQAGASLVGTRNGLKRAMPALIQEMKNKNCQHMRAHTSNRAVGRALRAAGAKLAEEVYRF
ncbi:hypothetical protein [Terasakiella sp. SH-1]|uniref:hypothetical protein n=1 Tax=Terasakiella sp. SH-1 TaxID=2560057 RepID=UPI0010738349|nr:hypothetical protein [Terasakiella sp. SH-1]